MTQNPLTLVFSILLIGCFPARADEHNKSTFVHFDEATHVGEQLLAPGYYQLRLANATDRHILEVYDATTWQFKFQLMALPAYRAKVTDKTAMTFREGRGGQVRSLKTWFYPGDYFGLEIPEPATFSPAPLISSMAGSATGRRTEAPVLLAPLPPPAVHRVRSKWALVIGVDKARNKLYDLQIAFKDAFDVAKMLADQSAGRFVPDAEHIRVLVGTGATREAIEEQIKQIGSLAQPGDLILIVYTSHGIVDLRTGRRYLATYNTVATDLEHTAFEMRSFTAMIAANVRAQAVVLLDACASGGAQDTRKGVVVSPMPRPRLSSNVVVISSSMENEDSWVSAEYQNSYFTKFFLEAMWTTSGNASLKELFARISTFLPQAVWNGSGQSQHPVMETTADTDAIFIGAVAN